MTKRLLLLTGIVTLGLLSLGGSKPTSHIAGRPAFLNAPTPWADSVLTTLSLDQRIAQLMMVAAWSNKDAKHEREVETLVRDRNIGGLIFFQGGPARQAALTNRYQAAARTPLLVGMDLEWGLAMRLDSTMRFPKQMTLGALTDDAGIERMGAEIARQMKRLGVQVSFSPVADVNNNPGNPVINDRSFGEDRELVARKSIAYMKGLQGGGVIATAKHFPGHGDTDSDSHKMFPVIAQTRARLDSLELYPFQRMVEEGLSAIMVGHLEVPALDTTKGLPSTLSKPIVSDLLEREFGFKGLVFTDALNMKGVLNSDRPGEIELRALLAGNDVLLFPVDPVKAIERIRQAVDSGLVPKEMIDHKCLKLLRAKEWAGLADRKLVATANIAADLNTPEAYALRRALYGDALTLLRNDGRFPLKDLGTQRIASLVIGDSLHNTFQRSLGRYAAIDEFRCEKIMKPDSARALLARLKEYDLVIASVHGTSFRLDKEFGVPQLTLDFLRRLDDQQAMAFVLFANPYRLTQAYGAQRWDGLLVAYEETDDTEDLAAQVLFGALPAKGKLPVTASSYFAKGDGLATVDGQRLRYELPEEDGMRTSDLRGIDLVVSEGLREKAYPGCQVLVARDGHVVWNKAYGTTIYGGGRAVRTDDIYDIASVSKVAGTTLALMKLVDEKKVDVERTLGDYFPEWTAKYPAHASMKLSEILTHQAGFKAFVPFYKKLTADGRMKSGIATDSADATHTLRVADKLYIAPAYRDSLIKWVLETPLGTRGEYVYSDMGMYLLMQVVERASGMSQDQFLRKTFYAPLGLATLGYQPLTRFPKDRIMPTENEPEFRRQQLQGDVHDPGAALMGGVAGHAGLFSDANDLAVLMQLLLNGGSYGGTRYLSDSTVALFTKCRFCAGEGKGGNRRALGWDKPQAHGQPGPACDCVGYASFGHTGFTGTMVWADPTDRTVYVFLSNRVYPNAANKKLQELDIRTRIQQVVHDAVVARRAN